MNIITEQSYEMMSERAVDIIEETLKNRPESFFILPTGNTPLGMYGVIRKRFSEKRLDFSRARFQQLDEYMGCGPGDERSFVFFLKKELLDHVNFKKGNIQLFNGNSRNALDEGKIALDNITQNGPVDLIVLGIGGNGHIGFNEPGTPFDHTFNIVKLAPDTLKRNFGKGAGRAPKMAITLGIATLLKAKKIIMLASGEGKKDILRDLVDSRIAPSLPASILRTHPDFTLITDKEAAKLLTSSDLEKVKVPIVKWSPPDTIIRKKIINKLLERERDILA